MMYGTEVKSACESMNVTSRVPASMSVPSVGQSAAPSVAVGGEYESLSKPALTKSSANCAGVTASELTISKDTTSHGDE